LEQGLVKFTNIWTFWHHSYDFRRLIFDPTPRLPGFDPGLTTVGFVVDEVLVRQFFHIT